MAITTSAPDANITSVLHENRVFPPPKAFARAAHVKSLAQYRKLYKESVRHPDKFWARQAQEELVWFKPWKTVLQWKLPVCQMVRPAASSTSATIAWTAISAPPRPTRPP